MSFWLGLLLGLFIGGTIGILGLGLLIASSEDDDVHGRR